MNKTSAGPSNGLTATFIASVAISAMTSAAVTLSIITTYGIRIDDSGRKTQTQGIQQQVDAAQNRLASNLLSAPEASDIIGTMSAEVRSCVRNLAQQLTLSHSVETGHQSSGGIILTPLTASKLDAMRQRCRSAAGLRSPS